jgi:cobalt-precorrin 5A hydrolase/precorrin-3B C17-methyltransferase
MSPTPLRIVALGFSPEAIPLLQRLEAAAVANSIRWPGSAQAPADWLAAEWPQADAVVAVGACGLVVRLVAPLLSTKSSDPAVVVLDGDGRYAIPLLGGHGAGSEALAQRLAALLGGEAVVTGSSAVAGKLALDAFGSDWGWSRGSGDWSALMVGASREGSRPEVRQSCGNAQWQGLGLPGDPSTAIPALVIDHRQGGGCRWHPPVLWLGLGCERNSSESLLERLVDDGLAAAGLAPEAVAGLASVDRKGDEPALLALARRRAWALRLFSAAELAAIAVPNPSEAVARELGTASVAEASALLAAAVAVIRPRGAGEAPGPAETAPRLLVEKRIEHAAPGERGAATLAVALAEQQWAPQRGELHLVGSGPGRLDLLSGDARQALARTTVWVGYGPYLDLLEPLRRPDQLRRDGKLTEERARCAEALDLASQGLAVALVSSGDSGIYGMAGLALELWLARDPIDRPNFEVHPGISALQLAAARAGAPLMHDFCTISLSDRLTPWAVIEKRLAAAAAGDFVVALYNPRSLGRDWQLERARTLLLEGRAPSTPVAVARQLGREGETVQFHTLGSLPVEQVDMLTLVLIGNSTTHLQDHRMVTPRGYPGASLA